MHAFTVNNFRIRIAGFIHPETRLHICTSPECVTMLRQKMLMMCARIEHIKTAQLPSEQKTPVAYYSDTATSSAARTCRQLLLSSA